MPAAYYLLPALTDFNAERQHSTWIVLLRYANIALAACQILCRLHRAVRLPASAFLLLPRVPRTNKHLLAL